MERGQRVGLIKFGSRVDVILPAEAVLQVKVGQRVRAGRACWQRCRSGRGGDQRGGRECVAIAGEAHAEPHDSVEAKANAQARLRRGMFLLPSLFTAGNIGAGYFSITQTIAAIGGNATRICILTGRRWRFCLPFPLTRWMGALRG